MGDPPLAGTSVTDPVRVDLDLVMTDRTFFGGGEESALAGWTHDAPCRELSVRVPRCRPPRNLKGAHWMPILVDQTFAQEGF